MPTFVPDLCYSVFESPVGPLTIAGDGDRLHLIAFPSDRYAAQRTESWRRDDALFAEPVRQLRAYFAGDLTRFDLPLRFAGTEFQNRVWRALTDIPYGETLSYGDLAQRIGKPTASRAVGAANGANPLPIVVPCHRVIGADRSLTGFGGGVEVKRFLLDHERRVAPKPGLQHALGF